MEEYWVGVEESRGLGFVLGVDWWMARVRAGRAWVRVREIRSMDGV